MIRLRQGCRAGMVFAILATLGCGGSVAPPRLALPRPVSPPVDQGLPVREELAPLSGPESAVSEIVWGGTLAPRSLGVRLVFEIFPGFK